MKKFIVIILFLCFFCQNMQFFQQYYKVYSVSVSELTSAKAMATIESSTGRLLFSKNEKERLPMASTTKIITAIVAIENCKDLDKKYEIPKEAVGIEGSSIYLKKGEHLSVRELLYGLMLRSGNDAAVAIAIIVGGTYEKFVLMMNNFCISHGLKNTHIVTVNGLHHDNHYTSALDLAKISAYALKNKIFAEIVSTKFKQIDNELDKNNKVRYLKNKNRLLNIVDGADGVKTGFTKIAGRCFVGSATRNGMQVVCVVLDCVPMFEETASLIEKSFEKYKLTKLFSAGEFTKAIVNEKEIPAVIDKDIYYPLSYDEIRKINAKLSLYNCVKNNLEIGSLDFRIENDLIFSHKIYTIDVETKREIDLSSIFKKIIISF